MTTNASGEGTSGTGTTGASRGSAGRGGGGGNSNRRVGSQRSMSSSRSIGTSGSGSTGNRSGGGGGSRSAPRGTKSGAERRGSGSAGGGRGPQQQQQQQQQRGQSSRGGGRNPTGRGTGTSHANANSGSGSGRRAGARNAAPRSARSVSAGAGAQAGAGGSGRGGPRSQRQMYQNQAKQQQQSGRSRSAGADNYERERDRNAALDRKISQSSGRGGRGRGSGRGMGSGGRSTRSGRSGAGGRGSSSVAQIDERIERKMDQQRQMMSGKGSKSSSRGHSSRNNSRGQLSNDQDAQMQRKKQQANTTAGSASRSGGQSAGRSQSSRRNNNNKKKTATNTAAAGGSGGGGGGDDASDDRYNNKDDDRKPAAKGSSGKGKGGKDFDNENDEDDNEPKKKPKGLIGKINAKIEERDRKQAEKLWEERKKAKAEEKQRRKDAGIDSDDEDDPEHETFRIEVPEDAVPGEMFTALAGDTFVRLMCPESVSPGEILQLTVPKQKKDQGIPPDSENVRRVPGTEDAEGRWQYLVKLPDELEGHGQRIPITIRGMQLVVTVPENAEPGSVVKIRPPAALKKAGTGKKIKDETMQLFEVVVPKGVKPGNPFALLAGGVRVQVQCPWNAKPGMKIRFNLPKVLLQQNEEDACAATKIKNSFDKDGWSRTIRVSDMKFQWVRLDGSGAIDVKTRFDSKNSAYVRELTESEGDIATPHLCKGDLKLIAANDQNAVTDSSITDPETDEDIVSFADIAAAQIMDYEDKAQWFLDMCQRLSTHWEEGHIGLAVRRDYLLHDSMVAVLSLPRDAFHKTWRFEFIGEAGLDAGGLTREWFQLVTEQLFDPDIGLWVQSADNQMLLDINPASKWCCPEDHLKMFRFLGRVMGKAMFDGQLVAGHMIPTLYKVFLMFPLLFPDLKDADEALYNNLNKLEDMPEDQIEYLCLDFTVVEEAMGSTETVDLIPNGADTDVEADNLPEFLEANFKYRMLGRVQPQLTELVLGFLDVIPECLLIPFDFQEIELILCGLPHIDMEDWVANTEYTGALTGQPDHQLVKWWWEVVEKYDEEMKARLLQFVTATSGVPSRGFGYLQGNDGNIMKFTIMGVEKSECLYPRSHTCFNRIDLPMYDSKEDLEEKLTIAITMVSTGFDIE